MQWTEVKVVCENLSGEHVLDMIAGLFYELGRQGVIINDPHLEPDEKWGPNAVMPLRHYSVSGYFPKNGDLGTNIGRLREKLERLEGLHHLHTHLVFKNIDEKDWAESWKEFFWPQEITSRIVVKPTWREYAAASDQLVIEIDPGMAFGTGTHPTTSLCIQLLEDYLRTGDAVLDVGTGSGILLIAAAKLGASHLAGIDSDAMAVDVARKNLIQNNIDSSTASLTCGDLVNDVTETYEVVVANILAEVIIALLDDVPAVVKPGGLFICSGIIKSLQDDVMEKMSSCGFDILGKKQDEDWVALVGRRSLR